MKEEHLEQVPVCCFCAVSTNIFSAVQQATVTLSRDIAGCFFLFNFRSRRIFQGPVPTNFKLGFVIIVMCPKIPNLQNGKESLWIFF